MRNGPALAIVLAAGLATGPSAALARQGAGGDEVERWLVDEPAPAIDTVDLEGRPVRSKDLLGKVVLVNFWAIWCAPCRKEIPHLVEMDRRDRDRGLVVLGANYGDEREDVLAYVRRLEMSYPVLLDDGLADAFRVVAFPTSVVLGRNGRIRYRVEGFRPAELERLRRVVDRLLAEGEGGSAPPGSTALRNFSRR